MYTVKSHILITFRNQCL